MSTTIMNDYERRFQRSLQKLTIPSWYRDKSPSLSVFNNSKQSIISPSPTSWNTQDKEVRRIPEILYVRYPHSSRSCRSSMATSPSPSVQSWHPNHLTESSRRERKYQKGIERVSNSSRWYQPTQFTSNQTDNIHTGNAQVSTANKHKQNSSKNIHYDTPKIQHNDECFVLKPNDLVTSYNESTSIMIINEKQQDNHIKSNESQIMPLAITKEPSSRIELETVADEEQDNRSLSMNINKLIPPITNLTSSIGNDEDDLLERIANNLVESVLSDVFIVKNLNNDNNDDNEDQNSGVRELSEDENGLRELDENDMNDTDEFIVFPTQVELANDDDDDTSSIRRCSLNKIYTFSKIHSNSSDTSKQTASHQNSPTSTLEKDTIATNSQLNRTTEELFDKLFIPTSICQSHVEPQMTDFDEYIDKIPCPSYSQLGKYQSSEGVNEETARIGRLLLNSMPTTLIHNIHQVSQTPVPIYNTNLVISEHNDIYDSPRQNSNELQSRIIDEFDEELNDEVLGDSAYSSNQERINIQQSFYEPLSECFSGFSFIQSDFLTPNISSVQSTTDEAYESEPTTMSSSIGVTTYVHPDLEHEFEYPSPPPPIPDRRLKPDYLKNSLPNTKPRLIKQDHVDHTEYSTVQKSKPLPSTTIQQLIVPTSNDSNSMSKRTMSSRHYCGSIPVSDKSTHTCTDSPSTKSKEDTHDKTKEKRNTCVLNCLHPSTVDDDTKRIITTKCLSPSLNKIKTKKHKFITDFDEATNGLAIRLPAPVTDSQDLIKKHSVNKTTTKRTHGLIKDQHFYYETSV